MSETKVNAGPAPGSISALILRLARTPTLAPGEAWAIPLRPGDFVGRYEIVAEIGRGGFGVVYEALDRNLGRAVAVKTVRPGRALAAEGGAGWLQDEAEAVASLSHRGIVAVYDVGEADGAPYVVMELLRGETLEQRLERRAPLPCLEAVRIAQDVATALDYAHARGVMHRDLKPANVFLCEDGTVKLLDFGLAHVFGHARGGPRGGGTPAYLAPERWRGEPEDARTDLFSLGVLLYELLYLRHYLNGDVDFDQDMVEAFLLCTTCKRCDDVCQLSIPIQSLWDEMRGQLIQNWFKNPAVSAKGGRKFQENRPREIQDLPLERPIRNFHDFLRKSKSGREGPVAPATDRPIFQTFFRNPVFGAAMGTGNDQVICAHPLTLPAVFSFTLL